MNSNDLKPDIIVSTENFVVWKAEDPDGEPIYHIDLGICDVRYFTEEWEDFKVFAKLEFDDSKGDESGVFAETEMNALTYAQEGENPPFYILDMGSVSIILNEEDYNELLDLFDEMKSL